MCKEGEIDFQDQKDFEEHKQPALAVEDPATHYIEQNQPLPSEGDAGEVSPGSEGA